MRWLGWVMAWSMVGCVERVDGYDRGEEELDDPITAGAADGAGGYHEAFECPRQASRASCMSSGCSVIEAEIYAFDGNACTDPQPAFFCVEEDEAQTAPQVFFRVVREGVVEVIAGDDLPGDGTIHGYPEWKACDFCPTRDSEPACQCPPWPEC